MAPPPSRRLQVPSVSMDEAYYSTNTLTSTTPTSDDFSSGSPRTLYAQTFELPKSSRSMPPAPKPTPRPSYHKNMMTFTGYQTTEEEFDTLPLVMQRKVSLITLDSANLLLFFPCGGFLGGNLNQSCTVWFWRNKYRHENWTGDVSLRTLFVCCFVKHQCRGMIFVSGPFRDYSLGGRITLYGSRINGKAIRLSLPI